MKIRLPVTWEMCGFVEVEADSIAAALNMVFDQEILDHIALPEGEYVDGSFCLSCEEPEYIALYQQRKGDGTSCPTSSN